MKHISLLFLILSAYTNFAQTKPHIQAGDVQQLATTYQQCLDKGENMYGCAVVYYTQLDSCLNLAYKQLRNKLDKNQQVTLKLEELSWLKTRDQKFKTIEQTNTVQGRDGDMIVQDKKDAIVKERVLQLIKKLDN
jgi:uncharacterized protein YecT (DUF1311 family)